MAGRLRAGVGRQGAGPRHLRGGRRALRCASDRAAKVMDLDGRGASAGRAQLAECGAGLCRRQTLCRRTAAPSAAAIASFPGLAHRMEDVGRIGKVRFVNDSKATNADASGRALVCFADIFWIAGGKPKEGGIASLAPYFPAHPQGLSDRRGCGGIRRARWTARSSTKCPARWRMRWPPPPPMPRHRKRRPRGAAVAGLRLVRPVPGFRAARRRLPRLGRTACASAGGVMSFTAPTAAASPTGGGPSTAPRFLPCSR